MNGYIVNIERESEQNDDFRKVLYTAQNSQLVVMSIEPGGEIGEEVHKLDQFIRIEKGEAKFVLNGVEHEAGDSYAAVIPAGVKHNVINVSDSEALKLYTLYSPPNHRDGVMHKTKEEAGADDEHFDGKTTE
ncbi:MAG: cupin domain-containing protein [Patescibacteria group bacterium]